MADILIRGMEMPKSCDECRLFNESWCMALGVENWRKSYNKPPEGGRLPDCPLVPLPEGHGRLIDADALDRAFTDLRFNSDGTLNHWGDRPGWCMHGYEVEKLIADAPTIVPADVPDNYVGNKSEEGGGEDG